DDRMTPAEHSLDMARRMPHSELEIMPDSGHMMILEHYPQVNHQLRHLVARVRDQVDAEAAEAAGGSGTGADHAPPARTRR
ncbi:MAG: alpha/beta hydrolase, partial [Actinomycetota bacterium]|nr:alpha/beta hydrolase [Actinomycetota bacterium]